MIRIEEEGLAEDRLSVWGRARIGILDGWPRRMRGKGRAIALLYSADSLQRVGHYTASGGQLGAFRAILKHEEALGRSLFLFRSFESAEIGAAVTSLAAKPGSSLFDVGANIGLWTLSVIASSPAEFRVVAVEPLRRNLERLANHIDINGLSGRVSIAPVAASDMATEIYLDATSDSAFARRTSATAVSTPVAALPLDEIWISQGRPDVGVLKIDVEGQEVAVLKGAAELLVTCRPDIIFEANGPEDLRALRAVLPGQYVVRQPKGFQSWNFLASVRR